MLNLFYTAVMFYTRIPVPNGIDHSEDRLNRATVFFPLIGWIVGGIAVCVYGVGSVLFPPELAVLLSMAATVWTTGAFHEDGFADVCDGFGGGWSKPQILTIMKDSRVGTYGVVGLGLLLAVKFFAVKAIFTTEVFGWAVALKMLAAHSLSRLTAVTIIAGLPYAREDADSKVKPIAKGITGGQLLVAALIGLLPLLALVVYTGLWLYLTFLLPLVGLRWWLIRFFRRWIDGYTGDCLGATQQLAEVVVYLSFVAFLWTSI
ncbi:adenosylcobinamide-GDP ribazoletransferase [Nibrella viscosa]|uniref:Adenosylcobinamide-GDP ribazoletransferase n=1 Tax=Nibrella viscosa TaxID=1084524 RepID=A0ABP8KQY8_9BACT